MVKACFLTALVIAIVSAPKPSVSQAAAESVLTHGLSSSAGSAVGKTLGKAMNNAAVQLGNKVGQHTMGAVQVHPRPKAPSVTEVQRPVASDAKAQPGNLIASIQGDASSGACKANIPAATNLSKNEPAPEAAPRLACPQRPQGEPEHPSVVNLPPSQ